MKRNPPQTLLEDGIKATCVLGAPFLTYKYLIIPYLKPELDEHDRAWDDQVGEGDLETDIGYAGTWLIGRAIYYGLPLIASSFFGYLLWEKIEERYL